MPSNTQTDRVLGATAVIVLGALLTGTYGQTCLSSRQLSSTFVSPSTWNWLTQSCQHTSPPNSDSADVPYWMTFVPCAIVTITTWIGGACWLAARRRMTWTEAIIRWGWYGWIWWCLIDVWEWLWIATGAFGLTNIAGFLSMTPHLWIAACVAGWLTTWLSLCGETNSTDVPAAEPTRSRWLGFACTVYFVVFTGMNWGLYLNLLVPHGDSAMYEEHLWNLLHGKGFRSYLDQGLFFGEHIQFVHLFLLPFYAIWPSHLLLEASSSAALACGAFPVFWMIRRQTGSHRTAFAIAVAYLLYFPMQFLDIEIDLKTFRPESFGIPLLLLTLDQLDRRSRLGTLVGIGLCLTVKEDYAIIFGPLGLWIAFQTTGHERATPVEPLSRSNFSNFFRSNRGFGLCVCGGSVAYLWLATRIIMPWFRSGAEVHYASYFARFGKSPEEIVRTMFGNPSLVFNSLVTPETALYAIALLAPLAFLPLLAPGRLAVGMPLFAILCLNELEGSRTPQHQFHAPLVAIIFWSLAAALPRAALLVDNLARRLKLASTTAVFQATVFVRHLVWTSALTTGIFFSLGPLGIPFWDTGSSWNWKRLYAPSERAAMFARIANQIPLSARVASTDFVHPRFTHYERSYDYSGYQRKVSGIGRRIPEDTDYVVIDTQHRYSTIKRPSDVPEWRDEPERWELVPDETNGYFIVLKRKDKTDETRMQGNQ